MRDTKGTSYLEATMRVAAGGLSAAATPTAWEWLGVATGSIYTSLLRHGEIIRAHTKILDWIISNSYKLSVRMSSVSNWYSTCDFVFCKSAVVWSQQRNDVATLVW